MTGVADTANLDLIDRLDLEHPDIPARLANLLIARREATGRRRLLMARASGGRWTRQDLVDVEARRLPLTAEQIVDLAEMYGADLSVILPARLDLAVGPDSISTGGVEVFFTPGDRHSMLTAYLALLRRLRACGPAARVELRRRDVEVLANALGEALDTVLGDLAVLVHPRAEDQRNVFVTSTTGVAVISLCVTSDVAAQSEVQRTMAVRRGPGRKGQRQTRAAELLTTAEQPIIVMSSPAVKVADRNAPPPSIRRADVGHSSSVDDRSSQAAKTSPPEDASARDVGPVAVPGLLSETDGTSAHVAAAVAAVDAHGPSRPPSTGAVTVGRTPWLPPVPLAAEWEQPVSTAPFAPAGGQVSADLSPLSLAEPEAIAVSAVPVVAQSDQVPTFAPVVWAPPIDSPVAAAWAPPDPTGPVVAQLPKPGS